MEHFEESLEIIIDVFFFDFNINEDFTITQTVPRSYLSISIGISHQQHDRYETIQVGMIIPDCFIQEEHIEDITRLREQYLTRCKNNINISLACPHS